MIKDNWYCCPYCGQKLFKVKKNFQAKGIEFKCKKCKRNIDINYEPLSHETK